MAASTWWNTYQRLIKPPTQMHLWTRALQLLLAQYATKHLLQTKLWNTTFINTLVSNHLSAQCAILHSELPPHWSPMSKYSTLNLSTDVTYVASSPPQVESWRYTWELIQMKSRTSAHSAQQSSASSPSYESTSSPTPRSRATDATAVVIFSPPRIV